MRSARLASDHERISALALRSGGLVSITRAIGRPPSQYVLELKCRGVKSVTGGRITYSDSHTVEILLGPQYPFTEPTVELKTPIVHPHIWPNNRVCLGGWKTAEFLDLLVKRLFKVIQYFPEYLDPDSVANYGAQDWADDNPELFPLGSVVPGDDEAPSEPARPKIVFTRS